MQRAGEAAVRADPALDDACDATQLDRLLDQVAGDAAGGRRAISAPHAMAQMDQRRCAVEVGAQVVIVTLGLRSAADQATMDHLAGFARAAGAVPVLEVTPGFEALLLEGPACDIMIVTSRPGHQGRARISAPRSYVSVASPMGGASFDGSTVSREFAEFETAIFLCRRP